MVTQIENAYLRLYTDSSGETHFDDVDLAATERRTERSSGVSRYAEGFDATKAVFRHVVQETAEDELHNAPRRQFVVMLEGHAEIEVSDGERRTIGPGAVVLVEDDTGRGHITRGVGDGPRRTLFIWLE